MNIDEHVNNLHKIADQFGQTVEMMGGQIDPHQAQAYAQVVHSLVSIYQIRLKVGEIPTARFAR